MPDISKLENRVFSIKSIQEFDVLALEVFAYQFANNTVYREYCEHLGKNPANVDNKSDIPFLPIGFFKTKKVVSGTEHVSIVFESSGTTGAIPSTHYLISEELYRKSILEGFKSFYGDPSNYVIMALLPSYLERDNASLVYMVNYLIQSSGNSEGGFYLDDLEHLSRKILSLEKAGKTVLLIGVTFALLDLAEAFPMNLENTLLMETGGMKGKRPEWIRQELHQYLKSRFGLANIHSEYGMTELLSQGYATKEGHFNFPPWVQVCLREIEDPLSITSGSQTGGLNIIDLANLYSCSFIATDDLGKFREDGTLEILGRFDNSDIRGCNLMVY